MVGKGVLVGVIVAAAVELGFGVTDSDTVAVLSCLPQAVRNMKTTTESKKSFFIRLLCQELPNGLRYRRLGRIRLGNGKLLKLKTTSKNAQSPSRPVHALLGVYICLLSGTISNCCKSPDSKILHK